MESGRAQIMRMQLLSFVRILPRSFKRKAYESMVRPVAARLTAILVNALDQRPGAGDLEWHPRRPPQWLAADALVSVAGYRTPIGHLRGRGLSEVNAW
jgi:hypothetical protein